MLRTKKAIHEAFVTLFHHRRYDEIHVGDIADDADVGRSTFYEHYRGKDDLLVQSMAPMLDVLAEAVCTPDETPRVEDLLEHFWENRLHGRYLLAGPSSQQLVSRLTRELTRRIEERLPENRTTMPPRLIAIWAAEGTFAVIRAWLAVEVACAPGEIASGLRGSALA